LDTSDDGNGGDGSSTSYTDSDGDGVPNHLDLDSDNDGIHDLAENPNGTGTDANNDGIVDGSADADNDGILDSADSNDALAGSPGSVIEDTDGDGNPDSQDLDSDNDGITDLAENPDGTGTDANNDGIVDGTSDSDNDGILDSADSDDTVRGSAGSDPTDTDGDGLADAIDLDSDNDGITDLAENPDGTGTDSNNDGIVDGSADSDGDGILNSADSDDSNAGSPNTTPTDTDGDGLADAIDLDSDNDGITDLAENPDGTGADSNNDGIVDGSADADGDGILDSADSNDAADGSPNSAPTDTDGDGIPNSIDLDSDNDGITDLAENPDGTGTDANNDGIVDGSADADGDGILDSADSNDATAGSPNSAPSDSDGDGVDDAIDLDSDNDGITDLAENTNGTGTDANNDGIVDGSSDSDGDGILNSADSDDSNDGSPNSANTDLDGDGLANSIDIDADNDGITDIREDLNGSGTDANNDGIVDGALDTDGDGILNSADTDDSNAGSPNSAPNDSDSDGLFDFVDIDADNDGIVDLIEAQLTSGTPTIPSGSDTDGDGLDNSFESPGLIPIDTDGDTTPDYLDSDSDDDGESDLIEGWDTDGDGTAETTPANNDADGDGLDDNFDNYNNSTPDEVDNSTNNGEDALDFPNEDEGGIERDWREVSCAGGDATLSAVNTTTVASDYCVEGGWTYYYNPSDSTEILFGIEHNPAGGNTNDFTASVSLTVSSDPDAEAGVYSAEDAGNEEATFVMGRYWNVSITSGTLNGNVNVRFFYDTDDADTLQAVAERWNDSNAGSTSFVSGRRWFRMNTGTFDDGTADLLSTGIAASSELFPAATSTLDGTTFVQFDGLASLTGGGMAYSIGTNSVILPVELIAFDAKLIDGVVECIWVTANEINSDYFEVEKRQNEEWELVGTLTAAGNSNNKLTYTLADPNPHIGESFYRLKTVDTDGAFEYSVERPIFIGSETGGIRVYPNPNNGSFTIDVLSDETINLELFNAVGQRIRLVQITSGMNSMDVTNVAAGTYFLKSTIDETPISIQVIVY